MVKKYLAIVALKDCRQAPNAVGEGWTYNIPRAVTANVPWAAVFDVSSACTSTAR